MLLGCHTPPPENLYPNGFGAYSTKSLPHSRLAHFFSGMVETFGANYLSAESPEPTVGLHFWIMDPALYDEDDDPIVPFPSALPGLPLNLRRNPLCGARPAEFDGPSDYISPLVVAQDIEPFMALLPLDRRSPAKQPLPRASSKTDSLTQELENAHWVAISLMQARAPSIDQMAAVKETGLPARTWMQVLQCVRISSMDPGLIQTIMSESTFYRFTEFVSRLAHSHDFA